MKIWKVYILLTVALLITITQISAQQAPAIVYTEHSCHSNPQQTVSMNSSLEYLHVNWFNIPIEQSPDVEISFCTYAAIDQQNADASDNRIPPGLAAGSNEATPRYTGMHRYQETEHANTAKGLKPLFNVYQKSTDRQNPGFRLYMAGTKAPAVDARPPSIPVSIVSIKAALKKAAVQVSWEAREEHQLNLYEVERSSDGVNFQTIGLVFPWDNQEASNNYEFRDQHPLPGMSYYRLRNINKDSSFTWSVIVPAGNALLPFNHISIMPNPVKGNIRAVFSRLPNATYNLELRSVSGTLQLKRTINIQQAEQLEILEPGYAPPGIYWLTIFDHNNQKLGSSRVVIR